MKTKLVKKKLSRLRWKLTNHNLTIYIYIYKENKCLNYQLKINKYNNLYLDKIQLTLKKKKKFVK